MALQKNSSESDPEASANCSIRAGGVCFSQGQYKEALEYFNRALEIQQKYFLPNNPSLAETYNYIGDVYYRQNEFK
jgi:tetratricopeptide (TPR) repeat protein